MRLVFVVTALGAGGAEKTIAWLAARRAAAGDTVTVLAFAETPGGSYFAFGPQVRLETFELLRDGAPRRSPARALRRLFWLRGRLAALRPDLVVSFLTKNNVLSLAAGASLGLNVLVSERNNPALQSNSPFWKHASDLLAPRASAIVMMTEEGRGRLPAAARARAVVIPSPLSLPPGLRPAPGDGERVVAVGRLDRQKGFDLLLEAFAEVARRRPRATLTVFGEGPERGALEVLRAKLGLEDRVAFPGVTDRPCGWVEAADVFVMSSRHEGFGNVLAEAVRAGLPSVAFDCDFGPRTILDGGACGLLVPVGDVRGLADALARLLGDAPLRQRLIEGCAAVAERFAPDRVARLWDSVIDGAAAQRVSDCGRAVAEGRAAASR